MFFHGQAMMKRQLREAETCQREAARTSVLAKRQEARERRGKSARCSKWSKESFNVSPWLESEEDNEWRKYSDMG